MIKYLKKAGLFFLIYLGISMIISEMVPYHWGNPWIHVKIRHLEQKHDEPFNTMFFGSSKVFRHFDPQLFDSLVNQSSDDKIRSFNMGAPGTFTPETFYLYEEFLNSELSNGVKYCFFELCNITRLRDHLMHQARTNYWLNWKGLRFTLDVIANDTLLTPAQRAKDAWRYGISYLENVVHFGHFSSIFVNQDFYNADYLGPRANGFLLSQYQIETTSDFKMRKMLIQANKSLSKNPYWIQEEKDVIESMINHPKHYFYNKVLLEKVNDLIHRSSEKGITLIFVIPKPRRNHDGNKILNLYKQIDPSRLITLYDPNKYPQLYTKEHYFDRVHLNEKGAQIFTGLMANQFMDLCNE